MRERIISVEFDTATEPTERFSIGQNLQLGYADQREPAMGRDIARRNAKRFAYVSLGLRPLAHQMPSKTYFCVRIGQIAIQHQRSVTLGYALNGAVSGI